MNDSNIEEFLRNIRPVVKDDPTFILETHRRLETVEGIKEEVDRQRSHGRTVVLVALFLGLFTGILATAVTFIFPEVIDTLKDSLHIILTVIPNDWRILLASLAILAIAFGLVVPSQHRM